MEDENEDEYRWLEKEYVSVGYKKTNVMRTSIQLPEYLSKVE
jgi:hypothetical protein